MLILFLFQENDPDKLTYSRVNFKSIEIEDNSNYSNLIFALYYFAEIDQIGVIEESKRILKLYESQTLKFIKDITFTRFTINGLCFAP
jgi:hypothetical protein